METIKKQIITGLISLIVSLVTILIILRSEAWGRKADKTEVYRIEQEVKKDIDRHEKNIDDIIKNNKSFEIRLEQKLDDHQKQIIDILKGKK